MVRHLHPFAKSRAVYCNQKISQAKAFSACLLSCVFHFARNARVTPSCKAVRERIHILYKRAHSHFIQESAFTFYTRERIHILYKRAHSHFIQESAFTFYTRERIHILYKRAHSHFIQESAFTFYTRERIHILYKRAHSHFIQ